MTFKAEPCCEKVCCWYVMEGNNLLAVHRDEGPARADAVRRRAEWEARMERSKERLASGSALR